MSGDFETDPFRFWVSDLDDYVSPRAIQAANDEEARQNILYTELSEIGQINLLSCKSIDANALNSKGITPAEWRWELHEADRSLSGDHHWSYQEEPFLCSLVAIGRAYAISRYSKWEKLSFPTALTATFKHGLRALLDQYLRNQKINLNADERVGLSFSLKDAEQNSGLIAYERVAIIRTAIHTLADAPGNPGATNLDRERTREILSLARLYYSVREITFSSLDEIRCLERYYLKARSDAVKQDMSYLPFQGLHVKNWRLRHLHPLTYYFPYSVRNALHRAVNHKSSASMLPDRSVLINELALARCGIILMQRNSRSKS